jgi:hypothetical protein
MQQDDTRTVQAADEDAATVRHTRYGELPPRPRHKDRIEETGTDPPVHALEQSITVVQHPGRTYDT